MTDEDRARVNRIMAEATSTPPKRIYPDDALFLIQLIQELLVSLTSLKK